MPKVEVAHTSVAASESYRDTAINIFPFVCCCVSLHVTCVTVQKSKLEFAQLDAASTAAAAAATTKTDADRDSIRALEAAKAALTRQLEAMVRNVCLCAS